VEKQCLRRAHDIVVISPFVRQVISPFSHARLHIVENPVHDAFFRLEPQPQPGHVLVVGSIQKRKSILEAIQAITLVRRQVPHARLFVAGGFSPAYQAYGDEVRRHVAESGAEGYVHFMGHLGHVALLEAYRSSQLFLFPSRLEAAPVALEESMAAGLPAVASDIGGTEHLVEEGATGYRVPLGDIETLAERVQRLLNDPALCRQFGARARQVARSRFTAELAAQKTHDLYLSLSGPSRRSAAGSRA
jgi:glycosyltransferase involved in cell wall biosynthesis